MRSSLYVRPEGAVVESVEISAELRYSVLSPYRPECSYLERVTVDAHAQGEGAAGRVQVARGEFAVPQSFYIQSTGHFNAVEFNLSYNQLTYVFLGHCAQQRLLPTMELTFDEYLRLQLPGVLILEYRCTFRDRIDPRHYLGELYIDSIVEKSNLWLVDTRCAFGNDSARLAAEGSVLLAVMKPRRS